MKNLTAKQKKFCEKYIELGNKVEAYRQSYNASKMKTPSINKCVQELWANPLITSYVFDLQNENFKEFKHTINDSLKYDFEMIARYNKHLVILENAESTQEQVQSAKRTMNFIGVQGFNAAMDRVSKKLGFYEKDNEQKKPEIINEIDFSKLSDAALEELEKAYKPTKE